MDILKQFFSFSDPNIVTVVLGSILITSSAAVVGCFTFLKKKALVGDAVAHAVLPGICLSFLLQGQKNSFALIIGAFITGWLALVAIDFIVKRSKIKEDTAIAVVLSVSFGLGILLLTYIQHTGNAAQSGLQSFLFGKAAALIGKDLILFSAVAVILLVTVILFFKELKIISFDEGYAEVLGLPVNALNLLLTSLTVMAVVTGIQAVGVVLMAAILITPAAAAKFWTDNLVVMTVLAALFGAIAGFSGSFVSFVAPQMPTGPWIVMLISMIALFSFFFAPKKGILSKQIAQSKLRASILEENLLKEMYHLRESQIENNTGYSLDMITVKRQFPNQYLRPALRRLSRKECVEEKNDEWLLTEKGYEKGKRIVKLHRLWEMYLSTYLKIAPDHVHEDAETIEHIITPELEAKLEKLLDYPERDPHNSKIPY